MGGQEAIRSVYGNVSAKNHCVSTPSEMVDGLKKRRSNGGGDEGGSNQLTSSSLLFPVGHELQTRSQEHTRLMRL